MFETKIRAKKSAGDKIDLKRSYEDFAMHEPEKIEFDTEKILQIHEN